MNNEEKILLMLEGIQNQIVSMEHRFDTIDNRFDTMEGRFDTMEENTNEKFVAMEKFISREIQSTRDELKLEIQHVYDEVKELREDFNNIEQVTAKNWLDISRLKSVR